MTSRTCPRCHSTLQLEDANTLVFCSHCGAPQVTLSEELQDLHEQQNSPAYATGTSPAFFPDTRTEPEGVLWSLVIKLCGIAGLVLVVLMLATTAFLPASMLMMLWIVGAPIILIGIYASRRPTTRITTGFGAQFGLLTGIAIASSLGVIEIITAVLMRFVFHQGAVIDAAFNTAFNNVQNQPLPANTTAADAATLQQMLQKFAIPEYRIGTMLAGFLGLFILYALYTSVAGAFAGYLRSRTTTR